MEPKMAKPNFTLYLQGFELLSDAVLRRKDFSKTPLTPRSDLCYNIARQTEKGSSEQTTAWSVSTKTLAVKIT